MSAAIPLAFVAASVPADFSFLAIYGRDNRKELHQVHEARKRAKADASVAIFDSTELRFDSKRKIYKVEGSTFGDEFKLCPTEKFLDQPSASVCSGVLIASDQVLTAGHCIHDLDDCTKSQFVFGYLVSVPGVMPLEIPAHEVYACKEIIVRHSSIRGPDFAVLRLDRKVKEHQPIQLIAPSHALEKGMPVYVAGYPSGLPLKIAGGAAIQNVGGKSFFHADVDTSGGSSGSPVFLEESDELVGIAIQGEDDFVRKGDCRIEKRCRNEDCTGEDIQKITDILDIWKKTKPL